MDVAYKYIYRLEALADSLQEAGTKLFYFFLCVHIRIHRYIELSERVTGNALLSFYSAWQPLARNYHSSDRSTEGKRHAALAHAALVTE